MASRLTTLPAELIEHITCHLPVQDISRLRLVCHALESRTRWKFGQAAFPALVIILSSPLSVQTLLEVTKHPAFVRHLHRIDFVLAEVQNERQDRLMRSITNIEGLEKSHDGLLTTRKQRATYLRMKAMELEYQRSQCESDLTEIFSELKQNGRRVAMSVGTTQDFANASGMRKVRTLLGYTEAFVAVQGQFERAKTFIRSALKESGYVPKKLVFQRAQEEKNKAIAMV